MRYASLHRTIERGLASDTSYRELVKVCLELELREEALDAFRHIQSTSERNHAERLLSRAGLMDARQRPTQQIVTEDDLRPTLREEIVDSVRFLTEDHLPLTVALITISFPVLIGLGGSMTADSHPALFPTVTILPLVFIIGLVASLARRTLLDAKHGYEDAPPLPDSSTMFRDTAHLGASLLAIGGPLLGLPVGLMMIGARPLEIGLAFAVAVILMPMALLLRESLSSWDSLKPQRIIRGVYRGGAEYLGVAAVFAGMLAPAVVCGIASSNAEMHIRLAVIGPVLVAPLLMALRLLGRFAYLSRQSLCDVLAPVAVTADASEPTKAEKRSSRATAPDRSASPHSNERTAPTQATSPTDRPHPRYSADVGTGRGPRGGSPAPRAAVPAGRKKASRAPAASTNPPKPSAPNRPESTRTSQPSRPVDPRDNVGPQQAEVPQDLTQMPGFRVVRGEDRVRMGAAARLQINPTQRPPL